MLCTRKKMCIDTFLQIHFYFVQNVSLLNNFVAGIVVFLVYIALFTIYVYFQIRKGYEIMPGEAGLVFSRTG